MKDLLTDLQHRLRESESENGRHHRDFQAISDTLEEVSGQRELTDAERQIRNIVG